MFAPLINWEAIKDKVVEIKNHAVPYEDAYNKIQESLQRQDDIRKVLNALPQAAKIQVDQEKKRLTEARRSAKSEKGANVRVSSPSKSGIK